MNLASNSANSEYTVGGCFSCAGSKSGTFNTASVTIKSCTPPTALT